MRNPLLGVVQQTAQGLQPFQRVFAAQSLNSFQIEFFGEWANCRPDLVSGMFPPFITLSVAFFVPLNSRTADIEKSRVSRWTVSAHLTDQTIPSFRSETEKICSGHRQNQLF